MACLATGYFVRSSMDSLVCGVPPGNSAAAIARPVAASEVAVYAESGRPEETSDRANERPDPQDQELRSKPHRREDDAPVGGPRLVATQDARNRGENDKPDRADEVRLDSNERCQVQTRRTVARCCEVKLAERLHEPACRVE